MNPDKQPCRDWSTQVALEPLPTYKLIQARAYAAGQLEVDEPLDVILSHITNPVYIADAALLLQVLRGRIAHTD